jgi:hypothetical protein
MWSSVSSAQIDTPCCAISSQNADPTETSATQACAAALFVSANWLKQAMGLDGKTVSPRKSILRVIRRPPNSLPPLGPSKSSAARGLPRYRLTQLINMNDKKKRIGYEAATRTAQDSKRRHILAVRRRCGWGGHETAKKQSRNNLNCKLGAPVVDDRSDVIEEDFDVSGR